MSMLPTAEEVALLRIVEEHPGLTLKEYASRSGVSQPTAMLRLNRLEGMGLVTQGEREHGMYRPRNATEKGRRVLRDVTSWKMATP